jgi:hypothetical protein
VLPGGREVRTILSLRIKRIISKSGYPKNGTQRGEK